MHSAAHPRGRPHPEEESRTQIVVLHRVPWREYDRLCRAQENSAGPRMAYLEGELQIMSPGRQHEADKTLIARLIEAFGEEMELSLNGFGSETFRKKAKEAGVEPDECYCIGHAGKRPDIAIEVVDTHPGIDKLEIYHRLEVPEVWFWMDGAFQVYRLANPKYQRVARSRCLPTLDLSRVAEIVSSSDGSRQTEAVRAFRKSLRRVM